MYKFNKDTLTYDKVPFISKLRVLQFLLSIAIPFGVYFGIKYLHEGFNAPDNDDIEVEYAIGTIEWKMQYFNEYAKLADLYLSQAIFEGTQMNGDMLALAAWNAYDSTGIILPIELALAQGQMESSLGTKGRSPINNPYNIGEWDNKTVKYFNSPFEGIQSYYYYMTSTYLKCKSLEQLFVSFTNCGGYRYASSETYEQEVHNQYSYIKRWIAKELTKINNENFDESK